MTQILNSLWEVYKNVASYGLLILFTLIVIVGGEFHVQIYWHHVKEFLKRIF
jgi:hypothetical protein